MTERVATLAELETTYSLLDVRDANRVLDAKLDAEARAAAKR